MRKWIFLGLWILSLVAISCYGGAVSYGIFFGLTFIPVISLIYLCYVYFRFRIYQEVESRNMVCGQPMPYYFVLRNDDYSAFTGVSVQMYSSFSYVEEMPEKQEYELLPGEKFTYQTKIVCKYRGEYEIGVKEIVVTDFFRLFKLVYAIPSPIKALALPKLVHVEQLKSMEEAAALQNKDSLTNQMQMDTVVRNYVEGDSLKRIHWKASAREQKLMVRNLTGEEKSGITLICDTKRYYDSNKSYLPLENKIMETLLAIGLYFSEKGMSYTVCYGQNGIRTRQVEGIKGFEGFYGEAAHIIFDKDEKTNETVRLMTEQGIASASKLIFLIVHEIDDMMFKQIKQLCAGGVTLLVYLVTDEDGEAYVKQVDARTRITVVPIDAELGGVL